MVPGMLMSLKTRSICVRLAKMATASAASAASITLYPAPRRNSATALRIRISSSTTKTALCRVASSCDAIALSIAPEHPSSLIDRPSLVGLWSRHECDSLCLRRGSGSLPKNINSAHHLLRMIRLFQRTFVAEIGGLLRRLSDSRGENHIAGGMRLAKPLGKSEPIHAAGEQHLD